LTCIFQEKASYEKRPGIENCASPPVEEEKEEEEEERKEDTTQRD
jgi:hypothetical protein